MKLFKQKINFTQISNSIIYDNTISMKAKAVYMYLQSRPDDWEFYTKEIIKNFKESYDTILSAIKELETNKYLKRIQKREQGKFSTYNYFLFNDKKEYDTENTDTENTDTVNLAPNNTEKKTNTKINKEINKDNDGKPSTTNKNKLSKEQVEAFMTRWNNFAERVGIPPIKVFNKEREKKLNDRIKEAGGLDCFMDIISRNWKNSSFLSGETQVKFKFTIDFVLQASSFLKMMEGNYIDKDKGNNW